MARVHDGSVHFRGVGTMKAKAMVFRPLREDHPCFALVGRIASEQARIEYALDILIAQMLGVPYGLSTCVTGQMVGPTPRYNAIYQLAHERRLPAAIIKKIGKQLNKAIQINELRNRAVHDPWHEDDEGARSYQTKGRPKRIVAYGPALRTEDDLKSDLDAIRKFFERVKHLRREILAAL